MSRSGSYSEELSRSLKGRHQSLSALEELLISSSRKGGDQFIALVCNVDGKHPTKISSGSIENSESIGNIKQSDGDDKHLSLDTINAWDMMADLDEQGQLEEEVDDTHKHIYSETKLPFPPREFDGLTNMTRRSKSCQWLSTDNESSFVMKEHGLQNEESPGNIRVGSRSFHTVDEYDAIMNGLLNTKANREWEGRLEDYLTNINMTKTSYEDVGDRTEVLHEMEGKSYIEKEGKESGDIALRANNPENAEINTTEDVYRASSSIASSSTTDIIAYRMGNPIDEDEKKVLRMAKTKDLKSLSIPSIIIEFPVARSLKGWIDDTEVNEGQVINYSSAGDYSYYVTPRFGSFGLPILPSREKCFEVEEESVFDPAMVSSYEMTMEQLQVEEEFLLKLASTLEGNKDDELVPHSPQIIITTD
ncbi:hypothetical protein FRX31_012658 [Thalictrum thalictroides]|uniref:Uncharacterized protein n=1 Tax=Thalictrum thalictroides TaxID=46969 RepID=A0A7J6WMT0_THATH|nr:hypothetical protein FRX31_012658 [Thalictrum thalictroides]